MDIIIQVKNWLFHNYVVILPVLTTMYTWITRDLMVAISQADKNNDGSLTGPELEDMAVDLIKNSKNLTLKAIPEFVIRILIQKLCSQRKVLLKL